MESQNESQNACAVINVITDWKDETVIFKQGF